MVDVNARVGDGHVDLANAADSSSDRAPVVAEGGNEKDGIVRGRDHLAPLLAGRRQVARYADVCADRPVVGRQGDARGLIVELATIAGCRRRGRGTPEPPEYDQHRKRPAHDHGENLLTRRRVCPMAARAEIGWPAQSSSWKRTPSCRRTSSSTCMIRTVSSSGSKSDSVFPAVRSRANSAAS